MAELISESVSIISYFKLGKSLQVSIEFLSTLVGLVVRVLQASGHPVRRRTYNKSFICLF